MLAKVDTKLKLVRHLGDLPDYYRHLDYYLTLGYARHIGRENPFLELVTGFFVKHQRFPSLVELSDIVFQSPATIKRALKSQGLTYRQLISDCRYVAARKLLLNPALSIKEIAWRLGYRDDNAFRRAFKNWAGMPPGAWRREHSRDN